LSVTHTKRAARSRRRKKRAVRSRRAAAAGQRGQKRPRRSVKPHPRSPSAEPDVRLKVGRQEPSPEEVQAWARQAAARMFDGPRRPMGLTRNDFEQAWSRVGKTDEARARWLLDFAARDLSALSGADWLNLRWEVFGFLYPPSGGPPPFSSGDTPGEPSCSADQVRRMHRWLRSGLERLQSGEGHSWAIPLAATPRWMMLRGRLMTWPDVDASFTESFKLKAYEALGREAQRFRVCARCGRPFLARKRQAYCTKRCSQTVRTRRYRAGHRSKVNELQRVSYKRNKGGPAMPRSGQSDTAATSEPRDVSRDDQREVT
jgi:hypothetical protein